jgi:large subunit ribosomal protein L22
VVKLAEVGRGIVMKRFHARGRGRSATVEKWFSHLKIVVAEREAAAKPMRDARPEFKSKKAAPVKSVTTNVTPKAEAPVGETA